MSQDFRESASKSCSAENPLIHRTIYFGKAVFRSSITVASQEGYLEMIGRGGLRNTSMKTIETTIPYRTLRI